MSAPNAERRPHDAGAASRKSFDGDTSSVPEAMDLVRGVFVLVVTTPTVRERAHRRQVFLSLAAAQHAADRAVERGHHAEVVPCRLVPEVYGGAV